MCASGRPISRSTASGVRSAWASIGSRSSTPYRSVVSRPAARSARVMTSRMTGPRRLPTWTVPDGVFESLTTCDPATRAASSSAHSMVERPLADGDDLVVDVAGRDLDGDVLTFLVTEERAPDRALVADPALRRLGLGRADDRERLRAVRAGDLHGRADLDVVVRVVLVDERGVLDQRLERLDAALDERLLVLGVLVLGVLGEVAVLLRVVDPLGDLRPADRHHLVELLAELVEAFFADVGGLVIHQKSRPREGKNPSPVVRGIRAGVRVGGVGYRAPGGVSKWPLRVPRRPVSACPRAQAADPATVAATACRRLPRRPCRHRRWSR